MSPTSWCRAGFAEAILGAKAGDTLEFTLTYPEDYEDDNLAGKNVAFMVDVKTVRETILPALDDELAKKVGEGGVIETLAQCASASPRPCSSRRRTAARNREARAPSRRWWRVSTVEYPAGGPRSRDRTGHPGPAQPPMRMGYEFERYLQMIGQTEEELRDAAPSRRRAQPDRAAGAG